MGDLQVISHEVLVCDGQNVFECLRKSLNPLTMRVENWGDKRGEGKEAHRWRN